MVRGCVLLRNGSSCLESSLTPCYQYVRAMAGRYYCPIETEEPFDCPRGSFCPPGTLREDQFKCPIGTFGNTTNLADATECSACTAGTSSGIADGTRSHVWLLSWKMCDVSFVSLPVRCTRSPLRLGSRETAEGHGADISLAVPTRARCATIVAVVFVPSRAHTLSHGGSHHSSLLVLTYRT